MKTICTLFLLTLVMFSCRKKNELSAEQKQKQEEKTQPLRSNELLEEGGLRFRVRSAITDTAIIQIDLKLYKGSGAAKSTTPTALSKDGNMNYSILYDHMENNTEYTLVIEYKKILQNAPYDLFTEGFTSQFGNKEFLITGHSFKTDSVGITKDLMLIKKGILKFSVYQL